MIVYSVKYMVSANLLVGKSASLIIDIYVLKRVLNHESVPSPVEILSDDDFG